MSVDKHYIEQYERYLKGKMTPEEAHAFERSVLDDPFASEALEGFEAHGPEALKDLEKLRQQIQAKPKRNSWFLRIAAAVSLLIVASLGVYFLTDNVQQEQLVMEEEFKADSIEVLTEKEVLVDESEIVTVEESPTQLEPLAAKQEERVETEVLQNAENAGGDYKEAEEIDSFLAEEDGEQLAESIAIADEAIAVELELPEELELEGEGEVDALAEDVATEPMAVASNIARKKREAADSTIEEEDKADNIQISGLANVARSASSTAVVRGKVTDDTGEPLPGVNVVIKGTTTGTTTDLDGNYMLTKFPGMILVYSFVGFETMEVEVGDRNTVDITWGGAVELQEVVVTGYGIQESTSISPARPLGGKSAYRDYIKENLQYPEAAIENEIEGTEIVEVRISSFGEIVETKIKKSLGYGCDEEAIRLIRNGPKWEAAKRGNTDEEDLVKVKVKFKLGNR